MGITIKNIALPAIDKKTGEKILVWVNKVEVGVTIKEWDTDYVDGYADDIEEIEFSTSEGEPGVDFELETELALEMISNDDKFIYQLYDYGMEMEIERAEFAWEVANDR